MSWHWYRRLLHNLSEAGETALRLNLDETSIVLSHDGQKGVVTRTNHKDVVFVPKTSAKRGSLTYAALVCDDQQVQPILPQMIIGNEHVLRVRDMKELEAQVPHNVFLVRAKSSWITIELMVHILKLLRKTLDDSGVHKKPVLLLDNCPVHLHVLVWRAARRYQVFLCFVPAKMTWLCQPLDVVDFRRFKAHLRSQYRMMQINEGQAMLRVITMVRLLLGAIRNIIEGYSWHMAFEHCGYSMNTDSVRSKIKSLFAKAEAVLDTPNEQPTNEDLLNILAKRHAYELQTLLWCVPPIVTASSGSHMRGGQSGMIEQAASSSSGNPMPITMTSHTVVPVEIPIALRTRSRCQLQDEDSVPPPASEVSGGAGSSCHFSRQSLTRPVGAAHRRVLRPQAVPPARRQRPRLS